MKNYVDGKVIIVTGAGGGFGRLTALKAAAMGGKLVCADINGDAVNETADLIKQNNGQAIAVTTDVTSKEQVDSMAEAAISNFGRIDVLINNAGIMPLAFFSDHKKAWKAWDKCIDINLKGAVHCICAVYDQMIKQEQGQIINISSIYSNAPVVGSGVYQATKIGLKYISDSLRTEAKGKIKVSTLKPTGVPTTGLMGTVINSDAQVGILAQNAFEAISIMPELPGRPDLLDPENIMYMSLDPDLIAENVVYLINQPMGVNISDITVRTSNDFCVL